MELEETYEGKDRQGGTMEGRGRQGLTGERTRKDRIEAEKQTGKASVGYNISQLRLNFSPLLGDGRFWKRNFARV